MDVFLNAIKCVNCRKVLVSPVSLPCGCSICLAHTHDLTNTTTTTILCYKCEIDHPISQSKNNPTFRPQPALAEIIKLKIDQFDFGQEHTEAQNVCTRLDELLVSIDLILNDPFNFAFEAIECFTNEAHVNVETICHTKNHNKKELKQLNQLIKILDSYKDDCRIYYKSKEYLGASDAFKRDKEKCRGELDTREVTLKKFELNVPEWTKIKIEGEKALKYFEAKLDNFKYDYVLLKRFNWYRNQVENVIEGFQIEPKYKFR
jgi:hypothetical protein